MDIETIRRILAWCTVFNWGLMFLWLGMFTLAGDWAYGIHGKWFGISRDTFNKVNYTGMSFYKMLVFCFNLVPYLVLRLMF